jgi:NADH-quinone oxidoreductase subunit J
MWRQSRLHLPTKLQDDEDERTTLLFKIFAVLTVAGAVAAMSLRNLVHAVLALIVSFAGLAAVYLLLGAQFIGLAQILVYVGAVAILIVFAILLTRDSGTTSHAIISSSWKGSGVVVLGVFGVLAWSVRHSAVPQRAPSLAHDASMQEIGNVLMQRFALPLEVVGVLLTVALIGAVTIAIYEKKETR